MPLKEEEIEKFMPLWIGQGKYHHDLDPIYYKPASEDRNYLREAIKTGKPNILVAIEDEEFIGFVTFGICKADYFDTNIEEFGEVLELFVVSKARGKGVGKMLMEGAEKYFKAKGVQWIKLYCSSYNTDTLKFYERNGFEDRQRVLFKPVK